jgi:hypothetical protein
MGGDERVLPLPAVASYWESLTGIRAIYYELGASAFHLVDNRQCRSGRRMERCERSLHL